MLVVHAGGIDLHIVDAACPAVGGERDRGKAGASPADSTAFADTAHGTIATPFAASHASRGVELTFDP
jgi:hypothetical protein